MKHLKIFGIAFLLILVLSACAKATPTTSAVPPASSGSSASLDGKTIMENACQSCHTLSPIYNQQLDTAGWTQVVDNMIQRGAVLTADERTTLIQYLAANFK